MPVRPMLFLTEAPNTSPSRRRDPLGFAKIAAFYADILAPGLTNRQRDPRWISILCWSLNKVRTNFAVTMPQEERYSRLRGLELRWVIETCRLKDSGKSRQLPGSREVRKILGTDISANFDSLKEKMGEAQWKRYRYTGPYASYRGLLISLGLIENDGWNLTATGIRLANAVTKKSGVPFRTNIRGMQADSNSGWVKYWLRCWPQGECRPTPSSFLPTSGTKLNFYEAQLIKPTLFGEDKEGKVRSKVAEILDGCSEKTHAELCMRLERDLLELEHWNSIETDKLKKLGAFALLSDAAVDALGAAFDVVANKTTGTVDINKVAKEIEAKLKVLQEACDKWQSDRIWPIVDEFAKGINSTKKIESTLVKLVRFHEVNGGGLLWLKLENSKLDKIARYDQHPNGYYRFRLVALTRMALGCGIITALPEFFQTKSEASEEENEE